MIEDAERFLVDRLSLRRVDLPRELVTARGQWKAEPVTIRTRAYDGELVRYSRFVTVEGAGLLIGNLLVLAHPNYSLPILGADIVALGGRQTMVAVDLSPAFPAGPARTAMDAAVGAALGPRPRLPTGGDLPEWCAALFSPHALYMRVDGVDSEKTAVAFRSDPEAFVSLVREAEPRPDMAGTVRNGQCAYAAAHRLEDKGLGLLSKMFGKDWADRYLNEVLFPS
jgi:phycocyanobilin:ferredoxin oxidoreductase